MNSVHRLRNQCNSFLHAKIRDKYPYCKPSIKRQPCLNSFALKNFELPQRLLLLLQDRRSPDLPGLEELQVLAALNTPQVSIQPSRTREG